MNKLSLDELKQITKNGDFDKLLDSIESEYLDCKGGLYLLNNNQNKFELAKDVTSFANSEGGFILIGPQTEKTDVHPADVIKKISLLTSGQIDIRQYFDVISEWVYPEILNLRVYWQESRNESGRGIFIIEIPKQGDDIKPFLVTKTVEGDKISSIFFGYSERKRDISQPIDVRAIQNILKNGLNYFQLISDRLGKIEQVLAQSIPVSPPPEFSPSIEERIQDCLHVNDMNKGRVIALCALPEQPNNLKTIFDRKEGSILRKLERPPELRYAGWDLGTLDRAKIFEAKYIQLCNGNRITIRLFRDGVFIFCAGSDFWAWPDEKGLKLNCLALVEGTFHFVDFCKEIISDFSTQEKIMSLKFHAANLHMSDNKTYLRAGSLESISFQHTGEKHDAPQNIYSSPAYTFDFSERDTKEIAYEVVKEIYLWFGISGVDGEIPYMKYENESFRVDTERIRAIK